MQSAVTWVYAKELSVLSCTQAAYNKLTKEGGRKLAGENEKVKKNIT